MAKRMFILYKSIVLCFLVRHLGVDQARQHHRPLHPDGQVPHEPERHQAVAHVQARGGAAAAALLYHGLSGSGEHALPHRHGAGGRRGVRLRWWVQPAQDWGLCRHVCSHYWVHVFVISTHTFNVFCNKNTRTRICLMYFVISTHTCKLNVFCYKYTRTRICLMYHFRFKCVSIK